VTDQEARRKKTIAIVAAVAVTMGLAGLAFYLGDWAHDTRSTLLHEGRLRRLVEAKPKEDQVVAALEQEGMRPVAAARVPVDVATLAARWGGPNHDQIIDTGAKAALTRAFAGDGFNYILYFDDGGTLIGFTFVGG